MLVPILISGALSALVTVALLWLTRRRLTTQFRGLYRRLDKVEHELAALKPIHDTTDEQLQRIHLALVRVQEKIARRYGPLAAGHSPLTELQSYALQQWSATFGRPRELAEIDALARALERARALGEGETPLDLVDLAALALALAGRPATVVAGKYGDALAPLLAAVVSGLEKPDELAALDALVVDADTPFEALLGAIKEGGLLVVTEHAGRPERVFPGLELAAAEWKITVYRKL